MFSKVIWVITALSTLDDNVDIVADAADAVIMQNILRNLYRRL